MGEFTVDHIAEEKLEGFIIRTFSVVHNKVYFIAQFTSLYEMIVHLYTVS